MTVFFTWKLFIAEDLAVTYHLLEARGFLNTGRYDNALTAYEKVLAMEPNSPKATFGRKKATLFAGIGPDFDAEAVATQLRALEKSHPEDPHVQVMLARLAASRGDRTQARKLYQGATELDPTVAQAWFGLGMIAHDEGRLDEARKLYQKALAISGNHRQYLTNLASIHLDLGEYGAARKVYEEVLSDSPHLLLARLDAGNAARLAGNLELASWHHERLLKGLNLLTKGDNTAQWVFTINERIVTMDAPDTKRGYTLLTVSATRFLKGDREEAEEILDKISGLPEFDRIATVIASDLNLLAETHPGWKRWIAAFRERFELQGR